MHNTRGTNLTPGGFDRDEIQRAIEASRLDALSLDEKRQYELLKDLQRKYPGSGKSPEAYLQEVEAKNRRASNFNTGRSANYHPQRPQHSQRSHHSHTSSCNFTSIFKRTVKFTLGTAALGLTAYVAYHNAGNIQNVLGNLQSVGAQLVTKAAELTAQYGPTSASIQALLPTLSNYLNQVTTVTQGLLANLPGQPMNIALGIFLLCIGVHKAVANFVLNHKKLVFTLTLLTLAIRYNSQANQLAANLLSEESKHFAKLIIVALADLMLLGFLFDFCHKAYDWCCGKNQGRFHGRGHITGGRPLHSHRS